MSKIKVAALGGIGENGKNMFVVEVDNRIFVLDAGLKYPDNLLPISQLLPLLSPFYVIKFVLQLLTINL